MPYYDIHAPKKTKNELPTLYTQKNSGKRRKGPSAGSVAREESRAREKGKREGKK
jgi:hypothetical protein